MSSDAFRLDPIRGNIFEELDVPDAEAELTRVRLFAAVQRIIREQRLTQKAAAELLGTSQPRVSRLLSGHIEEFNVECLERYLDALGYRLTVTVARNDEAIR